MSMRKTSLAYLEMSDLEHLDILNRNVTKYFPNTTVYKTRSFFPRSCPDSAQELTDLSGLRIKGKYGVRGT